MKISAKCPGTCGEFIQGNIKGREMLISPAIDLYSHVHIYYKEEKKKQLDEDKMYPKIWNALKLYAGMHNLDVHWDLLEITVASALAVGKGMASSTADMYAALTAFSRLWDKEITPEEMAAIATRIEPTDSIGFSEWTLMAPEDGAVHERIGLPFSFYICLLEEEGVVETISYSNSRGALPDIEEAYYYVRQGIINKDLPLIAKGCKISALKNQDILYKPYLDKLIAYCDEHGEGFNIAHTGTVAGIWFSNLAKAEFYRDEIFAHFKPYFKTVKIVKTVKGNPQITAVRRGSK